MKYIACVFCSALLFTLTSACADKAAEKPADKPADKAPDKAAAESTSKPASDSPAETAKNAVAEPAPQDDGAAAPKGDDKAAPKGDENAAPKGDAEAARKGDENTAPPAADVAKPLVVGLERFGEVKQSAAFTLAAGWAQAPKWGKTSFLPKAELESMEPTVLQLSTSCGGECSPAKIAANVNEALAGRVEGSKRPNLNTGDPALDAVRANVEVTKSLVADGHAMQAIRITYDAEVMKSGPYHPRFLVDCYAWRPTDDYYVQITASGPLASEATHLETIWTMCQSLKVAEAAGAPAEAAQVATAPAAAAPAATGPWSDSATGKSWQNPPAPKEMTWPEAVAYCSALDLNGTGWRLPTITELRSLVRGCPTVELGGVCKVEEGGCLAKECRKVCDSCTTGKGPAGAYWPEGLTGDDGRHWSSTAVQDVPGKVWVLDFGHAGIRSDSQDNHHQVRCVKDGK